MDRSCGWPSPSRTVRARRPMQSQEQRARARCSRSTAGDSQSLPRRRRSASRQYTPCEMRYVRMLSNSLAAACVATTYVLILVALVNPALRLDPTDIKPHVTTVGLYYTVH